VKVTTERQINERISEWAGFPCKCKPAAGSGGQLYWGACPMHERGNAPRPYTLSDAEAITLFTVLAEKGFAPLLHRHSDGWHVQLWGDSNLPMEERLKASATEKTICWAISAATLKLLQSI
jgi:formate-dependent phosphoribosylglycinamide formyltransferase (GAR transformylase)